MNNRFVKRFLAGLCAVCCFGTALTFAACGQTDNVNVGREEELENPLATPTNFSLTEDGSYSFDGVENANYYYLTIYRAEDATPDSDYLKLQKIANVSGKSTYSGNIVTDLSFTDPGYYSVQVVAYPVTGSDYDHSYRAFATYGKEGTIEQPQVQEYKEEIVQMPFGEQKNVSGGIAYDNNYGDNAPIVIALSNKDALNGAKLKVEVFSDEALKNNVMTEELVISCTQKEVVTKTLIKKDETTKFYVRLTALGDGTYVTPAMTEPVLWSGTFYTLSKITY